jgi:hypothetical protein
MSSRHFCSDAAMKGQFFVRPPAAIFQAEASTFRDLTLNPKPSGHEETDESRDAE